MLDTRARGQYRLLLNMFDLLYGGCITTKQQQTETEETSYPAAYYRLITHDLHLKNGSPMLRLIHGVARTNHELKVAVRKLKAQLADLDGQGIAPTTSTPGNVWLSVVAVTPPPPVVKDDVAIPYAFAPDPASLRDVKVKGTTPADLDETYALLADLSSAVQDLGHRLDASLREEIGIPAEVDGEAIDSYAVLSNYGVPNWNLRRRPPTSMEIEVRAHG